MIKGTYFSRYLKPCLFGLSISCIMVLGSFVSAFFQDIGSYVTSNYNNNFDNAVLKRGKFLGQNIGLTKPMFIIDGDTFFFWNDGKLYLYDKGTSNTCPQGGYKEQGFFSKYRICDVLTGGSTSLTNCGQYDDYNQNFVSRFLDNVVVGDIFYYYHGFSWEGYCRGYSLTDTICFSSAINNKSLCFSAYKIPQGSSTTPTVIQNLSGSLSLGDVTFEDISLSLLGDPPGYSSIDGGSSSVTDATIDGDVMTRTCTKKSALDWYRFNGYTDRLCYGGLNDFSTATGTLPIAGQGLDIQWIYDNTKGYRVYDSTGTDLTYTEWFNYWRNAYESYKQHQGVYPNPFAGLPTVLFTMFGMINAYGNAYTDITILNYCDLSVYTVDLSVEYNGINADTICNSSLITFVDQQVSSNIGSGPVVGSSWEGITDRPQYQGDNVPGWGTGQGTVVSGSTNYGVSQDGVTFQNGFFNLLKSRYKYPTSSGNGAIPGYILLALVGLVFFRFLRH